MDIADVFLLEVMLGSFEPAALLAWCVLVLRHGTLGWSCTGLGCDRCCPTCASSSACPEDRDSCVLSEQGVCWCLRGSGGGGGWGGGPGVDSVRDGVLDPLALSEVVGLLESMLRRLLPCTEFQGGASDSVLRLWGAPVPGQGWLLVQTVPKIVWRFWWFRRS